MADTRTNWPLILALWLAGLGTAAQYGKISVVFEEFSALYAAPPALLGLTLSVVGVVGVVLGVVAGLLVAGIGARRVLLWSLWLGAALSVAQSLLPALPVMVAARALEGLSHLGTVVAAPVMIAQASSVRDRPLAMTIWSTFFAVALIVLGWIGLPLAQTFGVSALFLGHAGWMVMAALLLSALLPRTPRQARSEVLNLRDVFAIHAEIYASPRLGATALSWLAYTFCFVSLITLLPPMLDDVARVRVSGAMPFVAMVVSMTLGVRFVRSHGATAVIQSGFALCILALVGLLVVPANEIVILLLSAAFGLVQGASFAQIAELNARAEDQARAAGALAQTGNLGNVLGTPVLAALGPVLMLPVAIAVLVAGMGLQALQAKRRAREAGPEAG